MQFIIKSLFIGAMLTICAGTAFAADPAVGTWNLNLAKSTFSPGPAPKILPDQPDKPVDRPTGNSVFNVPSSVLGAPVVSLPLTAAGGLLMGIQILGQPHTDARCAAYARWMLETLTPVVV